MGRIKPTKEELEELYINQRKTAPEIAKIYGYNSSQTISNLLHKYNIKIRNNKESQVNNIVNIDTEWLINAYEIENKSLTEIAKIIGCSINTIRRRLIELNIPIKKRYDLSKNNLPHYQGEKNPAWKGGKFQRAEGYIMIWNPEKQDYELEHRMVVEKYLGRKLKTTEQIHHKNGNKSDNRIENLEIKSISEHAKIHAKGKDINKYTECICLYCGKKFLRRTKEVERHPHTYCSRECYKKGLIKNDL